MPVPSAPARTSAATTTSVPSPSVPAGTTSPNSTSPNSTTPPASSAPTTPDTAAFGQVIPVPLNVSQAACAANAISQRVFVSISQQHAWICDGPHLVLSTPVTTGAATAHDSTPLGSWLVQAKQTDRDLVGPGYSEYVHYWVPFNGDFGFHDAPWQQMPFGSTGYTTLGSHGCVHLPTSAMKWLYGWAKIGAEVTIED
jgi:lipoprotein-anchoring transpeptidase ErfK/SrfK